jgi:hypothetical protein
MLVDGVFDLEAMMPHLIGFLLALGSPVVGFGVAAWYLRGLAGGASAAGYVGQVR